MVVFNHFLSRCNQSSQHFYCFLEHKINLLITSKSRKFIIFSSSAIAIGITLGITYFRGFEKLELLIYDRLVQIQSDDIEDDRFLTITITERDLEKYGWPISDQILATLLSKLQTHQPKVIGLDLYRNILHPPGQAALESEFQSDNLIAVRSVGMNPDIDDIPAPSHISAEQVGFNDFIIDDDGVIRRNLLFVDTEPPHYSFALRISLMYLSIQSNMLEANESALDFGDQKIPILQPHAGGYQAIDTRGYQTLLSYSSRSSSSRQITLEDALVNEIQAEWVQGKIILIGTTAKSIKDHFYTPYSSGEQELFRMPGVLIHEQMVRQVIDAIQTEQALYWFLPQWGEVLLLIGWCGVAGISAWYLNTLLKLISAIFLGIGSIVGSGFLLFTQMGWIPIVEPCTGFLICVGFVLVSRSHYAALRDPLTHLLNRDGFLDRLQIYLDYTNKNQSEKLLTVIFFDLDHFKFINESLGHQIGDKILQCIVSRVENQLPASAQLARVGGDEFAVSLQHQNQEDTSDLIKKIRTTIERPIDIVNQSIVVKASLGIAFTTTHLYYKADDLLRDAHTAMYRAKSLGRDRYEVFATGMHKEATQRLELESELRQAIEQQTFFLQYQPILCLRTGELAGFEALVRWRHHKRGFISPQSFIPIAEESGLIIPLGLWIFREACSQLERWNREFPELSHLTMSINLSGRQINQSDLVEQLAAILNTINVSNQRIRVEITETMLMSDVKSTIDLMLQLKELGLKLAIDDFGTGYSSLSYLHRFPIDYLKVDKSFIGQMEKSQEDYEIVRTIITLSHTLGMYVVAEGIETQDQKELLKTFNCRYGQGFLFSKPLAADDITRHLKSRHIFSGEQPYNGVQIN